MSHNRNDRDRDRHRRWGRRGWNDWGFFFPYSYPYTTAQYVLPPPVMALPSAPVYQAPIYQAPVYQAPVVANLAGVYRVVAPAGLNLRDRPDVYSNAVAVLRPGTEVQLVSAAGNGWVRTAEGRYLCMSCAEGPGGPWLVPVSAGPFQVAAPSSNATFFGQDPGGAVSLLDSGLGTALGFKPRKIRGHKKRTVCARPEVIFQATDLRIPRDVAKHFDIYEIRVGNLSLMASRDPIPAEMYSNEGCGFPLMSTDFPPVVPGQHIFLTVKNRSGSSHRFRAGFTGRALI